MEEVEMATVGTAAVEAPLVRREAPLVGSAAMVGTAGVEMAMVVQMVAVGAVDKAA